MLYLLNTAILTAFGEFRFSGPISAEEAKRRLTGGFQSAIGHAASADFLSAMLAIEVPVDRSTITMEPGDRALVLRLRGRLPEGAVLTAAEMAVVPFELGWLERLA